MAIPKFVRESGFDESDWVEAHDRLIEGKVNLPSNSFKWWYTNNKIRKALASIREEVKVGLEVGSKLPLRVVSESYLAKKALVTRISISHPSRRGWVAEQLDNVKKEILASRRTRENPSEIDLLKDQVTKARQETFVWYSKARQLEKDKEALEKVISTLKKNLSPFKRTG